MLKIIDDSVLTSDDIDLTTAAGILVIASNGNTNCSLAEGPVNFAGAEVAWQFSLALVGNRREIEPLAREIRNLIARYTVAQ